jgi:hypothetical protein
MVETITAFVFGVGCLAASRFYVTNPVTKKAAKYTGWTALGIVAVSSAVDLATVALAS